MRTPKVPCGLPPEADNAQTAYDNLSFRVQIMERKMENIRYLADVTSLRLDPEACVGCGACEVVCPHGVFALENGNARLMDKDACMECGACAKNCPANAITVSPGVGCAAYIVQTWFKGKEAACCGDAGCC